MYVCLNMYLYTVHITEIYLNIHRHMKQEYLWWHCSSLPGSLRSSSRLYTMYLTSFPLHPDLCQPRRSGELLALTSSPRSDYQFGNKSCNTGNANMFGWMVTAQNQRIDTMRWQCVSAPLSGKNKASGWHVSPEKWHNQTRQRKTRRTVECSWTESTL